MLRIYIAKQCLTLRTTEKKGEDQPFFKALDVMLNQYPVFSWSTN